MSDPETRDKHSQRRKKNIYAKILRDSGERKGAFALKVVDPRKGTYKREKLDIRNLGEEDED